MLPLVCLPECATCGTDNQGTRAKGGNSVRCSGCGTMRRVPMDRREVGPDDQRATRPRRGRPLEPGHPYRFQPSTEPRPAPATTTPSPPARERQRPAQSPQRPIPARRPEPAPRPAGVSLASLIQTMLSNRPATSSATGTPRRPAVAQPRRPAPAAPAVEPARSPAAPLRRPAATAPKRRTAFTPYIPCEHCVIDRKKRLNGQYAAAVAKIGAWMNDQPAGIAYVCPDHLAHFEKMARDNYEFRIAILEEPREVPEMKAMNCRYGNHTWYTKPGTNETRCAYCPATPETPTYVNPTTCAHPNAYYDASADAWRCPDCYDARPAYL